MDPLLSSVLDLCVHNMITRFLLHVVRVEIYSVSTALLSLRCPIMVGNMVEGGTR
jgi:hypothetical protein